MSPLRPGFIVHQAILLALLGFAPSARAGIQVLHAFEYGPRNPQSRLVQGLDGNFYGVAAFGAAGNAGCVFRLTPAGELTTAASFFTTNGAAPMGALVLGVDGKLYGTTTAGGAYNQGTVFSLTTSGVLTTLYSFDSTHGRTPESALVFGPDGALYGTTYEGGASGYGTVFKVTTSGALTTLWSFGNTNIHPASALCLAPDGNFYGLTEYGPANGTSSYPYGTIYRISPAGIFTQLLGLTNTVGTVVRLGGNSWFTVGNDGLMYGTLGAGSTNNLGCVFSLSTNGLFTALAAFSTATGGRPTAGLTLAQDGTTFCGTTLGGGPNGDGTFFQFKLVSRTTPVFTNGAWSSLTTTNGCLTNIAAFASAISGNSAEGGVTLGSDGALYGVTDNSAVGWGKFFRATVTPTSSTLSALASFADLGGISPQAALTLGPDGSFYGTTANGGLGDNGIVFRLAPNGAFTPLAALGDTNGSQVTAPMIVGPDAALYGAASQGGANAHGTLFRLRTNGQFSVLYSFPTLAGGAGPYGGVTFGPDGQLYGTTQSGGAFSKGTLFRVTTNGAFSLLYSFDGTNGATPKSPLLWGGDGGFYGTTFEGGTNGSGTVFRFDTNGTFTSLATFSPANSQPLGALVRAADGSLYGGLIGSVYGTRMIYRLTPGGVISPFFPLPATYGGTQYGGLTLGPDGLMYDAVYDSGWTGGGTLFRLSTQGAAGLLSSFTTATGFRPYANPIFGPDGQLYGTTSAGGPGRGGTLYRFAFDRITDIQRAGSNALVTATSSAGSRYSLYAATNLTATVWTNLATVVAPGVTVTFTDTNAWKFTQRFYRTAAE